MWHLLISVACKPRQLIALHLGSIIFLWTHCCSLLPGFISQIHGTTSTCDPVLTLQDRDVRSRALLVSLCQSMEGSHQPINGTYTHTQSAKTRTTIHWHLVGSVKSAQTWALAWAAHLGAKASAESTVGQESTRRPDTGDTASLWCGVR